VRTKATRTEGGWVINGQKVWTSDAHVAGFGLATVRTDSSGTKHEGITTMVIDMRAEGVEIRPLRQMTGESHFNEVFFTDVFVPDADVIGEVDKGWTVARATLGNERVSIGGGASGGLRTKDLIRNLDADPERGARLIGDVARLFAIDQALVLLNLRRAARALAGAEPGPEGNVTKLVLAEGGQALATLEVAFAGPAAAFLEGPGRYGSFLTLVTRGMSIAGGTSEITRNQIAERLLGLPRDPTLQ
jgi:alkylation response protein AidB-like acyl-CoA dehydrogenase